MFEVFTEGITLLNVLSCLAFFTTVGLFLSCIGICWQIWKQKDCKGISGAPFAMGVIGGSCWWAYGFRKVDITVVSVTSVQIILYSLYLIFYSIMCTNRKKCALMIAGVSTVIAINFVLLKFSGTWAMHLLGTICLILNVADFGAPLFGLKYVIRTRSTRTLPLPLCTANFLVSTEWFLYGILKKDVYLMLPNGIGSVLSTVQLLLFLIFPRKEGQSSPLKKFIGIVKRSKINSKADADKVIGSTNEKTAQNTGHPSWSNRVISSVVDEITDGWQMQKARNQFAYMYSLERADADIESQKLQPSIISKRFVHHSRQLRELKLRKMSRRFSNVLNSWSTSPLRRSRSSPSILQPIPEDTSNEQTSKSKLLSLRSKISIC